jgi:hypothetical protein
MAQDDKKKTTVTCMIMRDRWDENGVRVPTGTVDEFSTDEAMDDIENGTLERVKASQ